MTSGYGTLAIPLQTLGCQLQVASQPLRTPYGPGAIAALQTPYSNFVTSKKADSNLVALATSRKATSTAQSIKYALSRLYFSCASQAACMLSSIMVAAQYDADLMTNAVRLVNRPTRLPSTNTPYALLCSDVFAVKQICAHMFFAIFLL